MNKTGFTPLWLLVAALLVVAVGGLYLAHSNNPALFMLPSQLDVATSAPLSGNSTTTPSYNGFAEYHSGISGTLILGPTCPVQKKGEDCTKPYASTTVAVFRASDPVHPFALATSGSDGSFAFSLPPGDYVVGAGEATLPRCEHVPATVGPGGYVDIKVMCDTGIR